MAWLTVSGIDFSAIAATQSDPKGPRRDIGEISPANDGSMRATRQARKRDVSFQSIPLKGADAFAWESLVVGEGHVWSFDASYYSSKGLAVVPSDAPDTTIQASVKKYGSDALKINAAAESVSTAGLALGSTWTQSVWWRQLAGSFHHLVVRSDGARWLDGVRNDAATHPFGVGGGEASLTAANTPDYFDDWVVCPYLWPTTWPPLVFALGAAFSPLPYLTCGGDLVPEASTRKMIGTCTIAKVLRANAGAGLTKDVQVLQVDLLEY